MTGTGPMDQVLEVLTTIAHEAFAAADLVERFALSRLSVEHPRAGDLAGLLEVVTPLFSSPGGHVAGTGFVAAVGLLEDRPWWLEWYSRSEGEVPERLHVPLEPDQLGFYDYTTTAWFRRPRDQGGRFVTGPYVDYLCTEDQTLTFSQPVLREGRFLGVAACDIRAATFEPMLLPELRRLDAVTVVANAEGRVLCSNSGRYVCGDLLDLDSMGPTRRVPGLALVIASPDRVV